METSLQTYNMQLPEKMEELSKFVLINEERVHALRAQIKAIKKAKLAKEVYEQKLAEAQEIGQITVEAAQKMGELLLEIPKATANQYTNGTDLNESAFSTHLEKPKSKSEITAEMGVTKDQVSQFQQMALNPEAVKIAVQKAIEKGDVVSRSQVMKEISAMKKQLEEKENANNDLRSQLSASNRKSAEQMKRISELEDRLTSSPEYVSPSDYSEIVNNTKALATLMYKIQDMLDEDLSPLKFSKLLDGMSKDDVNMKNLKTLVSKVTMWCEDMHRYIDSENTLIIDMEV